MKIMSGFSFIELLVSLLLLSIALLGLDLTEITALRSTREAYFLSVATQQLENAENRLRVNHQISAVLPIWNQQNQILLPEGHGEISGTICKICWRNTEKTQCLEDTL